MIDPRVYTKSGSFVARVVGGETILVPIRNNVGDLDSIFTFTPVAARIWALIDGARPLTAIVDCICDEYDVEHDVAARDVADLIESLQSAQLIQEGESA